MNMSKKSICVVITARPSYARVRSVLEAIKLHPELELQIIASASFIANRFGSAVRVLEKDGYTPNWEISSLLEADDPTTAPKTTSIQLAELATAFHNIRPDMVVTIADRYETIATAIAASYMNIPLVHLQGGEVTGNIDEKVRHAISKLSDMHCVSNGHAADRLRRMGEPEASIHVTGCPSIDIARAVLEDETTWHDFDPFDAYSGVGTEFAPSGPYLVMLQHPLTTHHESARSEVDATLQAVHAMGLPAFCFWPNPDTGTEGASEAIRAFRENVRPKQFYFFKNLEPQDFLRLLLRSACLVGNSSVGIRECAYLGVPVVNVGDRQQGRERGSNVIDVDRGIDDIKAAIDRQLSNGRYPSEYIYGDGRASGRIANVLYSENPSSEKRLAY